MKRLYVLLLTFFTIMTLVGCSEEVPENSTTVTFYYIHNEMEFGTETPLLSEVKRTVPSLTSTPNDLIRLYLNGPTSYDCISPFPGGTELLDMYVDGSRATLVLSPHIGTMSAVNQTIAYACLTKTVIALTGVETVQLRLENSLINGEEMMSFSESSFAMFDSMTQNDLYE